jgi:hypothetical protein
MAQDLPYELTREILAHILDVPDEMFRDVQSEISPFARPSFISPSPVVCVCKAWMDAATSLLYQSVVLRSAAQARALERTLRTNTTLGPKIRKLRVEGGYGSAMHTIMTSAPNITEFCILMDIQPSDSVRGLCSSLSSINPSCVVILGCPDTRRNARLNELAENLNLCLKSWTNMVSSFCFCRVLVKFEANHRPMPMSTFPCTRLTIVR